jgi:hypothetical protein
MTQLSKRVNFIRSKKHEHESIHRDSYESIEKMWTKSVLSVIVSTTNDEQERTSA